MSVVFVSALFNLPSKRPYLTYLVNLQRLFECLPCPLVLFCGDSEIFDFAESIAAKARDRVTLCILPLEELPVLKKYAGSRELQRSLDPETHAHHSWELSAVWASKPWFVLEAKKRRLVREDAVGAYWIDAGFLRFEGMCQSLAQTPQRITPAHLEENDRIQLLAVRYAPAVQSCPRSGWTIGGGMFGGTWLAVENFSWQFYNVLDAWDKAGRFWGKEQDIYEELVRSAALSDARVLIYGWVGMWHPMLEWLVTRRTQELTAAAAGTTRLVLRALPRFVLTTANDAGAARRANLLRGFGQPQPQFVTGPTSLYGAAGTSVRTLGSLGWAALIERAVSCCSSSTRGKSFTPFLAMEDDAAPVFPGWLQDVHVPPDADLLYLGVSQYGLNFEATFEATSHPYHQHAVFAEPVDGNPELYRVYNMLSTHAVVFMTLRGVLAFTRSVMDGARAGMTWDIAVAALGCSYNVYAVTHTAVNQDGGVGGQQEGTLAGLSRGDSLPQLNIEPPPSDLTQRRRQFLNNNNLLSQLGT